MILFHHLTSIASYVRMNDETKGQKQALIDPKRKRVRSAQTIPSNNHPINSKQLLISPRHAANTPHGSDRDPCTFAAVPNACRHERMIPPGHRAADVFERCGIKICLLAGGRSSPHRPNGQNDAVRRCCLGCCGSNSCGLTSVGVRPPPTDPFQWSRHTSALRSPCSFCCCHSSSGVWSGRHGPWPSSRTYS